MTNNFMRPLSSIVLILIVIFAATPLQSDAQVWKNLGKKIEEKVTNEASRRAERKIDKTINKSFDKLEGSAERAFIGGAGMDQSQIEAVMGAMSADVSLKDQYDFKLGITYDLQAGKPRKKAESTEMTMWFSDQPYLGMEARGGGEAMTTVLDDGQVVIFMENQKSFMAIGSGMFSALENAAGQVIEVNDVEDNLEEVSFDRLADETVLGLRCQVYLAKSKEAESRIWVTEDLGIDMLKGFADSFSTLTRQNMRDRMALAPQMSGVLLKMQSKDLDTGESMTMEAKEIHRKGKAIRSADYKRAGM